ncbi:hypothetical protein [Streptomyces montanisoli]|uniref:Secreted protein n=1 Tax=Streptomyces montanisoli TaxID=2798581 RepID=A0A940RT79_9ACTN|nr:hypothetical protein [Streptomyces montanisoli]MBP0456562.1 hypothetical protein [Streptomyces montanisoli]
MRKLTRAAVAGALAAPLLMAAAGVASADESSYCHQKTSANEHGAWSDSTCNSARTNDRNDYGRGGYDRYRGGLLGGLVDVLI